MSLPAALALLLLSADTGSALAVVCTPAPGLEKVASEAGKALASRLEATHVELGGYLKSRGPDCQSDLSCLAAAPGLSTTRHLLLLRLRPLAEGQLAADLRLIDLRQCTVSERSASVVEPRGLSAWLEGAASRLLTRADPYEVALPPSPFALQPPAKEPGKPAPPQRSAEQSP
jgi:hypothetical protein